jgi:hypothetical protein
MSTSVSSRTPEGQPADCPACGARFWAEPTWPVYEKQIVTQITEAYIERGDRFAVGVSWQQGDAPCPRCGTLVWFVARSLEEIEPSDESMKAVVEQDQVVVWPRGLFERFERSLTKRLAEGVHVWNIEPIREMIARFDRTLETLESSDAKLIPPDARARVFGMIEELEAMMIELDTRSTRNKFRAEQRPAERAELAARNETSEILDRSLAPGLPPRQLPPRPSRISRLISWVRSTVDVHINPVSSYGTVYDRWLDG